jgi:hypothetical protein
MMERMSMNYVVWSGPRVVAVANGRLMTLICETRGMADG